MSRRTNLPHRRIYVMEYRAPGRSQWQVTNRVFFTQSEANAVARDEGDPWRRDGYEVRVVLYLPEELVR